LVLVPVAVVAVLVAACSAKPTTVAAAAHDPNNFAAATTSGNTLATRALDALRTASSYRVSGSTTVGSEVFSFSLVFARDSFSGTITDRGVSINVVRAGSLLYMQGEAHMMDEYGMEQLAAEQGKWGLVPNGNYFASLSNLIDPEHLLKVDGQFTTGTATTVNGVAATTLIDSKSGARLYVASSGTPYPLRYEGAGGTFDYSGFNAPVTITAPPADQVVPMEESE
jgi:hypothetical protein